MFLRSIITDLTWAARYNTWLLIKLTPKDEVFSFLSFFFAALQCAAALDNTVDLVCVSCTVYDTDADKQE